MATVYKSRPDQGEHLDGIGSEHLTPKRLPQHPNLLALIFCSTILILALLGTFGGQPHPKVMVRSDVASLQIAAPQHLRNGEFFEMRYDIWAHRPLANATLEISQSFLKDLTINTMIPAPEKEEAIDGNYRFSFGPLKAGEKLHVKMDGQINPPLFGGTSGSISLHDGDRPIVNTPVNMQVWP